MTSTWCSPCERFQPDPPVANTQVVTLDQGIAEVVGEVGVFEIGLAVRAGGQQHHPGVVAVLRRQPGQPVAQGLKEAGQALDMTVPEQRRSNARHDHAVFECIAGAGRRLRPVVEHPHAAVGSASQVGGTEDQGAAGKSRHPRAAALKAGVAEDQFRRQQPLAQQGLGTIEVGKDQVEEFGALDQSRLDHQPTRLR